MWKPGTEKPKKKKETNNGLLTTTTTTTDDDAGANNKKSPAIKKLSRGTMSMRFMQRTTIAPRQIQPTLTSRGQSARAAGVASTSTADDANDDDVDMMQADDDDNEDPTTKYRFAVATAEDMYGTVLMGRRSFGGFRPVVEHMLQQGEASVNSAAIKQNKADRKRKRNRS